MNRLRRALQQELYSVVQCALRMDFFSLGTNRMCRPNRIQWWIAELNYFWFVRNFFEFRVKRGREARYWFYNGVYIFRVEILDERDSSYVTFRWQIVSIYMRYCF